MLISGIGSDFPLPGKPASTDRTAVADYDARLSLAVLKYARHARGGRLNPYQLSEALDLPKTRLPKAGTRARSKVEERPRAKASSAQAGDSQDDRFFRDIVASMRNGVVAITRDGHIAFINDVARGITDPETGLSVWKRAQLHAIGRGTADDTRRHTKACSTATTVRSLTHH